MEKALNIAKAYIKERTVENGELVFDELIKCIDDGKTIEALSLMRAVFAFDKSTTMRCSNWVFFARKINPLQENEQINKGEGEYFDQFEQLSKSYIEQLKSFL